MSVIQVPDIPGPVVQLCWKQQAETFIRCDRRQHPADIPHTWEMQRIPAPGPPPHA